MNLSRPAGTRRWPRAFSFAFAAALLLPALAVAAAAPSSRRPGKTGKSGTSTKPDAAESTSATSSAQPAAAVRTTPEFADAYPSEIRPTPPDLLLRPEGERKADAFTAFAQGLLAEDGADADSMLAGYRKTLEFDPGYSELAVKVAVELARRGDPSTGIQILKDAVKASPKEALPNIYLSQFYARFLKKPDLAEKYANDALKLEPESFAGYLALYELHSGNGDTTKAGQILERAAAVPSKDPKFWIQLGNLYRRLYLKEDGTCGAEELKKMNAVHLKAAELGREDPAILTEVADYFVLSKQVKDAIPFYQAVLASPQESGDPQVANVRDKLARSFIITGQRDEGIAILERLARDNAMRFETYELLGKLYQERSEAERSAGETAKAEASLQRAVDNFQQGLLLDSSDAQNHLRLAELLMGMKQWDKAVDAIRAAVTRFPDVPYLKFSLAIALSQAKRHNDALATFAEAQADAENRQEELLNAKFFFQYAAAAEQAGLTDKAAELLKKCLELEPNSHEAMNFLGYMWVDRGENLEEAGALIKRANALRPDYGAYLDSLGWYYFKKGEPELALKELLRAAEQVRDEAPDNRDDPVVLDHIGDAYASLGKMREALDYWNKAMAIGIDDPKVAGKVKEKIEEAKQKLAQTAVGASEPVVAEPASEPAKN